MEVPDHRNGKSQHDQISDNVGKSTPSQICVRVDALANTSPEVTDGLARQAAGNSDSNPVSQDNCADYPAGNTGFLVGEDTEIEMQDSQLGGHHRGEVDDWNDDDEFTPGNHHTRINLLDTCLMKPDSAIVNIRYLQVSNEHNNN